MSEWLIFRSPQVLILFAASLVFHGLDRLLEHRLNLLHPGKKVLFLKAGWLSLLSAVLVLVGTALLFLQGASSMELITLLVVFLLINIGGSV